jgi:DNA-binding transcriptional LysR family regulator
MEIRHLRYFVAIAEERSFTRAAERLWVAQPGLSTQIRRLEAELGVRLFDRHTRGVDLTDAGTLFLERARAALVAADLARATGQDLQSGAVGSLRLGLSTEARWGGASVLLETFNRDRPAVEVTVVESHGGTVVRDLRDGRLDAVAAPAMFGSADLRSIELGREPWVVLVGSSHPLAGEGPLTADDLQGEQIVVTGHRDAAGYDRAVAETLAALGVAAALQRGGPGPALLAAVAAGEALALTTGPGALGADVMARPIAAVRALAFDLLWRAETPSPALGELIEASQLVPGRSRPRPAPALVAVA